MRNSTISSLDSTGASAWKPDPDLQVRAWIVLQPEDGRWVFAPEELNHLAESLNSVLQNSNPGAGWPFRLTLTQYIGLFSPPSSPELFPRHNSCNKDR
jgi:hypothetical protein